MDARRGNNFRRSEIVIAESGKNPCPSETGCFTAEKLLIGGSWGGGVENVSAQKEQIGIGIIAVVDKLAESTAKPELQRS